MPRKSSFPIWIDDADELTFSPSIEEDGFLFLEINGDAVFSMTNDDARDIASSLLDWAAKEDAK